MGINYEIYNEGNGGALIKSWTKGVPFEDQAMQQVLNIASLPFIFKHVAIMPDVHLGKGATIGSVIATKSCIVPSFVGVDIGCGMLAAKTSLKAEDLPDSLLKVRTFIESYVPHGRDHNGGQGDRGSWGDIPENVEGMWKFLFKEYDEIIKKHPKAKSFNNQNHLGTLGTGNHFIELCLDENGDVWVMLHSGSRGAGNRIGTYFIELAKKEMEKYFINLPDKDLAYLPQGTEYFDDYFQAVMWAQKFARSNREVIFNNVINALNDSNMLKPFSVNNSIVNCHHNYVALENHFDENVFVTRKGALRAGIHDRGIIPGSMGTKSYIVQGKGNKESFMSCSHGAGRKMSRGEAKKMFTLADHEAATLGIECRKDADVIDETPGAYKDIDKVIKAEQDLIEIVHTLKQVLCVKG